MPNHDKIEMPKFVFTACTSWKEVNKKGFQEMRDPEKQKVNQANKKVWIYNSIGFTK